MLIDVLAWTATATITLLVVSQLARATWIPMLYVLQALTVPIGCFALLLSIAALITGRPALAGVNAVLGLLLVIIVVPLVRVSRDSPESAPAQVATLTVLHANAYYDNHRVEEAAEVIAAEAARREADVIVITEFPHDLEAALTMWLGAKYPHRAGETSDKRDGIGLLSRLPIGNLRFEGYRWEPGLEFTVAGIRMIVVHPGIGLHRDELREWKEDLAYIADRASAPGPATLIIGDFNACRWHPPFRDILARGFTDAHERLGRGFTSSWPVSRWRPRFVRLDHALVDARLTPLSVADFRIPGSDHTGFVVTIGISERRAPR